MSSLRECKRQEFCSECVYNCIYELGGPDHQAELDDSVANDRGDDEFVEPIEAFDQSMFMNDDRPAEDTEAEPQLDEDD